MPEQVVSSRGDLCGLEYYTFFPLLWEGESIVRCIFLLFSLIDRSTGGICPSLDGWMRAILLLRCLYFLLAEHTHDHKTLEDSVLNVKASHVYDEQEWGDFSVDENEAAAAKKRAEEDEATRLEIEKRRLDARNAPMPLDWYVSVQAQLPLFFFS